MFENVTAKVYYRYGSVQLYLTHFHYTQEPEHQANHEYRVFEKCGELLDVASDTTRKSV